MNVKDSLSRSVTVARSGARAFRGTKRKGIYYFSCFAHATKALTFSALPRETGLENERERERESLRLMANRREHVEHVSHYNEIPFRTSRSRGRQKLEFSLNTYAMPCVIDIYAVLRQASSRDGRRQARQREMRERERERILNMYAHRVVQWRAYKQVPQAIMRRMLTAIELLPVAIPSPDNNR